MNITKEITRLQRQKQVKAALKRCYNIIKNFLCTHKNIDTKVVSMTLGNSVDSILEELIGEEQAKNIHKMLVRITYCADCGREISREIIKDVIEENTIEGEVVNE